MNLLEITKFPRKRMMTRTDMARYVFCIEKRSIKNPMNHENRKYPSVIPNEKIERAADLYVGGMSLRM